MVIKENFLNEVWGLKIKETSECGNTKTWEHMNTFYSDFFELAEIRILENFCHGLETQGCVVFCQGEWMCLSCLVSQLWIFCLFKRSQNLLGR